jgi:hypothetical protein
MKFHQKKSKRNKKGLLFLFEMMYSAGNESAPQLALRFSSSLSASAHAGGSGTPHYSTGMYMSCAQPPQAHSAIAGSMSMRISRSTSCVTVMKEKEEEERVVGGEEATYARHRSPPPTEVRAPVERDPLGLARQLSAAPVLKRVALGRKPFTSF